MTKNFTAIDDLLKKYKKDNRVSLPKEAEPMAAEKFEIKEVVEHKMEGEVRPFISPREDSIELPPDLKKMGLKTTSSNQFSSYQNIKLPLSDEKVVVGLHAPITSSIRWLATLAVYLLARVHLGLKVVHGKVIRVLRS
ncbi:MAG: hypothetical protein US40_C0003G0018 [Candidatus Roizmanbacteria bacterium GW2011_GWC2_37_13]|uniref:Uncharacterized protein n=1 Tax=Candidatus Roizmanbacteria bacterium GW2011_GWC2_37_13 TaxID=1618486 RepID=A0A0G0JDC1_9BACT|nr:MAG: hypothetical protein US38_C0004G0020 [Candidatus Roizmanbacteria bacterium GW2011_GWC1_37_12]KKQ26166.1 MAG: hypothetical protein US40_C0003G0018 [Candidatus Roizmanbacteria bacterium GW2011_GWC2_37_13]